MIDAAAIEKKLSVESSLLNSGQLGKLTARKLEMTEAAMSLTMSGDAASVSTDIGQYQYMRGKIDMINELLQDNIEAIELLEAEQQR